MRGVITDSCGAAMVRNDSERTFGAAYRTGVVRDGSEGALGIAYRTGVVRNDQTGL